MLRAKSKALLCINPLCEKHRGIRWASGDLFLCLCLELVQYGYLCFVVFSLITKSNYVCPAKAGHPYVDNAAQYSIRFAKTLHSPK